MSPGQRGRIDTASNDTFKDATVDAERAGDAEETDMTGKIDSTSIDMLTSINDDSVTLDTKITAF